MRTKLDAQVAKHFRDELRSARAAVMRDAEAWRRVVIVLERLGAFLNPAENRLARHQPTITALAQASVLAETIAIEYRSLHTPFAELYTQVVRGRNTAVHEGAAARRLSTHVVELALILEDALRDSSDVIADYMVREPCYAQDWQPISFVRHLMLANSFSFIPVELRSSRGATGTWFLISDAALVQYLRMGDTKNRLRASVATAYESTELTLIEARVARPNHRTRDVFRAESEMPVLVEDGDPPRLVGIPTPFDLL